MSKVSMRAWLIVVPYLCLAGCGGSSPSPINGTIAMQPFTPEATFFSVIAAPMAVIQLSTSASGCSDSLSDTLRRGARDLFLQGKGDWAPASYAVLGTAPVAGQSVIAYWRAVDDTCNTSNGNAISGSVVVSAVSASEISGTFDLTFDVGEEASGSFSALPCSGPATHQVSCP